MVNKTPRWIEIADNRKKKRVVEGGLFTWEPPMTYLAGGVTKAEDKAGVTGDILT